MARTLFFHKVLRKFIENTNNKPIFSQDNTFYKYKYVIFQSVFWLIFNHRQKVNQIRNNVVYVVARFAFVFWCALATGCCNAFQHFLVNQKKSKISGPYFQTMLYVASCDYDAKYNNFFSMDMVLTDPHLREKNIFRIKKFPGKETFFSFFLSIGK